MVFFTFLTNVEQIINMFFGTVTNFYKRLLHQCLNEGYKNLSAPLPFNLPIKIQGDHSPDNVKFPYISLTVHGTPLRHSAC